jgi:hypothetical protein
VAGFLVHDIHAARAEMKAHGIEFIGPIETAMPGVISAPDGFIRELIYTLHHTALKALHTGKEFPMNTVLIQWLVFLHILSAITFFLAHGTSAAMTFQVRKETDFSRIRALLDLSWSTMILMGISFLMMGLTGIILPFLLRIWNRGYIWLSIVLMLFVFIYMAMYNENHYKELRRLVGLPYMKGSKQLPAEPPSNPEEVAALLHKTNVTGLVVVGYIIPAIVLWLMVFKPF